MKNNTKKQDIIKAYAKVVEQRGIEGASLSVVAQEMEIPQSLIFHYFRNKEDLMMHLGQHIAELCIKAYEKVVPKKENLTGEGLEHYVDSMLALHANRRKSSVTQLYLSMVYLLPRQPKIRDLFVETEKELLDRVAEQLGKYREAGLFDQSDVRAAAQTLLTLSDGIMCHEELTAKDQRDEYVGRMRALYFSSIGYHGKAE